MQATVRARLIPAHVKRIDRMIPAAVKHANRELVEFELEHGELSDEINIETHSSPRDDQWNRFYHTEMNAQCEAEGLRTARPRN